MPVMNTKDNYLNFYHVFEYVTQHPKEIEPMARRPWRSSISARRIEATHYEYLCFRNNGDLPEIISLFFRATNGKFKDTVKGVHHSLRCGFVHPECFILLPIRGQWGAGIAVVENAGAGRVKVTSYYLYSRKDVEQWQNE